MKSLKGKGTHEESDDELRRQLADDLGFLLAQYWLKQRDGRSRKADKSRASSDSEEDSA